MEGRTGHLDPDTYCSPRSFDVARLAAGATIDLSLAVASGAASSGFALVRPPGHHAETNRPMGFCLVNQIALAAQVLRDRAGLERIAIVDWDVHHGNGTQEIFAAERDVLFISLHQYPHYPGSGSLDERGHGRGEGSTLNLPMPAGCGDAEYGAVFDAVVLPALREFRPEMILISAGFDAHARDPMASMELSNSAFGRFAAQLRSLADDICGGRLLLALEGGYDLEALGQSVVAVLESLCGPEAPQIVHPSGTEQAKRMIELYREAHGAHWASLRSRPSTAR
jgi:acetoin utilization deacetylase AcuC-like enzyme